jgi:excisionase family DNA binding protein
MDRLFLTMTPTVPYQCCGLTPARSPVRHPVSAREKMEPITCSIDDGRAALGIGRTSFYALLKSGEIEAIKLGRRRLIYTKSLEAFVNRRLSNKAANQGGNDAF